MLMTLENLRANGFSDAMIHALWKSLDKLKDIRPAATTTTLVDFEVKIKITGAVTRDPDTDAASTCEIPWLTVVALLCSRLGIQQEKAMADIVAAMQTAMTSGATPSDEVKALTKHAGDMAEKIKSEIIAKLPRKPKNGSTKVASKNEFEIVLEPALVVEV